MTFSSSALTSPVVVVAVLPLLSGLGWLTWLVFVTEMDRPAWTMLTAPMCTSEPMITVPVFSFTTTRAWDWSWTGRFSRRATSSTMRPWNSEGTGTSTVRASRARAEAEGSSWLMALTTRTAVVKSSMSRL